MPSVEEFNRLADDAARQALRHCCSSGRWLDALVAGRPYPDVATLLAVSDAAVAELSEADLREAMAGHPRIGDRRVVAGAVRGAGNAEPASWSSREQAGVGGADDDLLQALADGNRAYEQRFGHVYLACATGRDAAELLTFLHSRLGNDRETEFGVVASELAKINQIRLRKLLEGDCGEAADQPTGTAVAGNGGSDEGGS
jgi:2-oxo-4-hydroxy-4-carboxy-5-ureidoimidazoline decarboxylase